MVRGVPNISISTLSYIQSNSGKMSLPVDSSSLIYSHFKHVSGTLAPDGTDGVSISKLNLLDVLIGQLNQLKKSPQAQIQANPFEGVDSLIESYRSKISQLKAANASSPYMPSPDAQSGALFSLLS